MLLNLPTHQKREAWVRKSNIKMQDSESNRTNKQLDEARLKKMALKVVEEVFQSENLAEFKRMLVAVIVEVMNKLQREGMILNEAPVYTGEEDESRRYGQEGEQFMFLEDELVQTMRRRNQEGEGVSRTPLTKEGSSQRVAEEGPTRKSVEEVSCIGPRLELRPIVEDENGSSEVGLVSQASSSLEAPPGFEAHYGRIEKPNTVQEQRPPSDIDEGGFEVEDSEEIEENDGESDEKVPQTP